MILRAMAAYLTSAEPIAGIPGRDFRTPAVVGDFTVVNREEARRLLRERIGTHIYHERRPRKPAPTALTLQLIAEDDFGDHELTGGNNHASAAIEANVWTSGGDVNRAIVTGTLLRLCVDSFYAGVWDTTNISFVSTERRGTGAIPESVGDNWQHRYSLDFLVRYEQAAAVF